jgi:hypothetical protein
MIKFRKMYIGAFGFTVATALSGFATAGTCGACSDDAQIEASIKESFRTLRKGTRTPIDLDRASDLG